MGVLQLVGALIGFGAYYQNLPGTGIEVRSLKLPCQIPLEEMSDKTAGASDLTETASRPPPYAREVPKEIQFRRARL